MSRSRYPIRWKMLPGQPLDGSGKCRIHYFHRSQDGLVRLPEEKRIERMGFVLLGGGVGFIACQPERRDVAAVRSPDGCIEPFLHTDDVRAATCPECLATKEAQEKLASFQEKG